MFCDPENEFICLICIPGYYMNDNYNCIKISSNEFPEEKYVYLRYSFIVILAYLWLN